jgi:hypothetical protein
VPKSNAHRDTLTPQAAAALTELGQRLALARVRRHESLRDWAQRMGVSVRTLQHSISTCAEPASACTAARPPSTSRRQTRLSPQPSLRPKSHHDNRDPWAGRAFAQRAPEFDTNRCKALIRIAPTPRRATTTSSSAGLESVS